LNTPVESPTQATDGTALAVGVFARLSPVGVVRGKLASLTEGIRVNPKEREAKMDVHAYSEGGSLGLKFAKHSTLASETGESIRECVAAVKAFREQFDHEAWLRWEGEKLDFATRMSCPLALTKFFIGQLPVSNADEAEQFCAFRFGGFFNPLGGAPLDGAALDRLANRSFFKGMVDTIASYSQPVPEQG
jgi:hypothetical protein